MKSLSLSRKLRVNQTRAEKVFWQRVRNRQLDGFKFVRQEPVARYVCDFVCRERMLIVELDGGQHSESQSDVIRDRVLGALGYRVMRFWNNEVLQNIDGVLTVLQSALQK